MKAHSGFSLIELLVSLLILAIGVLGMLRLQTMSVQSNIASDQRTMALLILDSVEQQILDGDDVCKDDGLDEARANLALIEPGATLEIADNCPTDKDGNISLYTIQIQFSEVGGFNMGGQDVVVLERRVQI
ncbi:type IV pilus modification PilV family protein [Sansalvadorimonas verongulae]|uniref:type IV pilus modification PilV family protein n=1 Tax=Sansalvadorimonas verongulae TaxID=2172824 RepID=UPI0012BCFD60|nr:prepilin-type N-terminal cleavage/methylation domain-containing protein [Sansalvadorimonas verongulae]MTI14989.1 prepilin-type N-terminal cleavage/methylation domain-containing protein [Sansalvadorimonas verongulae]